MDRHLIDAFVESLTDVLTEKVAQRLGLRPPVKATPRSLAESSPSSTTLPASTTGSEPPPVPEYLTPQEVAILLRVSVKGLERMRSEGTGPKFVKVGGRVRYRRSDLG